MLINKPIFYEKDHLYINPMCSDKKYSSVTQILHKFEPKKDWYQIARNYSIKNGNTPEYWLEVWKQNNLEACERGTKYHNEKELEDLSIQIHKIAEGRFLPLGPDATYVDNLYNLPDGIYTELLVWNNDLLISGKSDKVVIETIDGIRYVEIIDYKTNKEIKNYNYINKRNGTRVINEMLLYPLNEYCNCNYWIYQLQLNIYGWLLAKQGFTFRGGKIIHVTDGDREYPLMNLQHVVTKLMNHING